MLEFNELCPPLMEKFIANGELPNFKRLRDMSECHITDAGEETENLEPWIQWPTVHTGLSFKEHGIFHLGDADKSDAESIWDILSKKGLSTWVCGSMNVNYDSSTLKGKVLPDPWSIGVKPSDPELEPYYKFVRANVQEHTNDEFKLGKKEYMGFLKFMLTHGMSLKTMFAISKQLVSEKLDSSKRWKRALLMDKMQWDVFKHEFKISNPALSTFFLNSTAHLQHKFWRYMEPEEFNSKVSEEDIKNYGNAILQGYRSMDEIVGQALSLKDDNTKIVFCTALSQQPYKDLSEKRFYRPRDFDEVVTAFGLTGVKKISPVMSEQFHVICENNAAAIEVADKLKSITLNGEPMFMATIDDENVFSGCVIHHVVDENSSIAIKDKELAKLKDLFYLADNVKSGMHNPSGLFWLTGNAATSAEDTRMPLTEVMGRILKEFNEVKV